MEQKQNKKTEMKTGLSYLLKHQEVEISDVLFFLQSVSINGPFPTNAENNTVFEI